MQMYDLYVLFLYIARSKNKVEYFLAHSFLLILQWR